MRSLHCQWGSFLSKIIACGLIFFTTAGLLAQLDTGLADNGDFTRAMTIFTSGPATISPNWPDPISQKELWVRRFFKYYIPYWKLDYPEAFSIRRPFKSTALLLWVPGIFLNQLFWSKNVLNIGIMSLPIRLCLIIFVWLAVRWIRGSLSTGKALVLLLSFVGPIAALVVSPYSRYLNSFYYESAALFFVPLFFCVIVLFSVKPFSPKLICGLTFVTAALVAGAKVQWGYWPLIGGLGALIVLHKRGLSVSWGMRAGILIVAVVLSAGSFVFTMPSPGALSVNAYHRFFYGILMLSKDARGHLARLGALELSECVGIPGYSEQGLVCRSKAQKVTTWTNLAKVVLHEPILVVKMLNTAAQNLHVIALPYLGTFSEDDPRSWVGSKSSLIEGVWPMLQKTLFHGPFVFLWLVIICFICWTALRKSRSGITVGLGVAGVLASVATFLDMLVAVFGEGLYELQKHLFMANLTFDISVICSCNIALLYLLNRVALKRG